MVTLHLPIVALDFYPNKPAPRHRSTRPKALIGQASWGEPGLSDIARCTRAQVFGNTNGSLRKLLGRWSQE